MGLGEEEAQEKFGFLLDAFQYGAPPHGGIAFGWDRIVALLSRSDVDPRRDRLPEDAAAGYDPLTGAPAPITRGQRRKPASTPRWNGPNPETESLPRAALKSLDGHLESIPVQVP